MRMDLPGCSFRDCRKCFDGNCKSIDDFRSCEFAKNKSILRAYQEECSADAEKERIIKEIGKLPEHIVSERNGFKRSFLEKDTIINIIENIPFN